MSLVRTLRGAPSASRVACAACFHPRFLHSSPPQRAKKNVKTVKNGRKLVPETPVPAPHGAKTYVKSYTEEERAKLAQKYTPEQLAAIDIGEEAVDPEDLYEQGTIRDDSMGVNYIDDFSKIRPWLDNPVKPPEEHYDPEARMKTEDELGADLVKFVEELPEDADMTAWKDFFDNVRMTKGKPEAELEVTNYVQPRLPKFTDPVMRRTVRQGKTSSGTEEEKWWQLLSKQTGWTIPRLKALRVKQLVYNRVSNQTRLGKIAKQYYLYVAGDGRGLMGIGQGSAVEHNDARFKARRNAIRSMVPIPRYERRTIFGDVKGKVGATELELFNRPPGFGLRCQEKILEMCKCAGISDISARVTRARNPMNTIKATMQALLKQRDPEQVSRARGRKMVDVRKVYYAGLT